MVRRRGRPRRSFAYLRIRRYRLKYRDQVIPIRFKLLLPPMHAQIETVLIKWDALEQALFPKFIELGIPSELWDNYLAWAKRKGELLLRFTDETLQKETDLLMQEFILRGLDKDILTQLEPIVDEWGGIVPLEGNYSDWAIYDSFDDTDASAGDWRQFGVVNKDETVILLIDAYKVGVKKYTIATKTLGALQTEYEFPGVYGYTTEGSLISVQGTYVVALIRDSIGIAIWKNGDLIKTFTRNELGFDPTFGSVNSVSISRSGKYIVVSGYRTTGNMGWVVLVGS